MEILFVLAGSSFQQSAIVSPGLVQPTPVFMSLPTTGNQKIHSFLLFLFPVSIKVKDHFKINPITKYGNHVCIKLLDLMCGCITNH